MLHTNLSSQSKATKSLDRRLLSILVFVGFLFLGTRLFASTGFSWDFSTAGEYTVSDSNKAEVSSGAARLKQVTTTGGDTVQGNFDAGTYNNTTYTSGALAFNSTAVQTTSTSATGLVSMWRFENDLNDSKSTNHGVAGSVSYVTSGNQKEGTYAASFNGTSNYVRVTNHSSLQLTTVSVALWIKVGASDTTTYPIVISKGATNTSYQFQMDSDDKPIFRVKVGATTYDAKDTKSTVNRGIWEYWVGTYDGETMYFYRNGALVSTNATPSGSIATNAGDLYIGDSLEATNKFLGVLDEVKIYNTVISASDVLTHYNLVSGRYSDFTSRVNDSGVTEGGSFGNFTWTATEPFGKNLPDNLASETAYSTGNISMANNNALWHFDVASSMNDTSGNALHGSAFNGAAITATDQLLGTGALSFDGNNDYANMGTSGNLTPTVMTLSYWIYPRNISRQQHTIFKAPDTGLVSDYTSTIGSNGIVGFNFGNGSGQYLGINSTSKLRLNEWQHILVYRNGSQACIYIDGTQDTCTGYAFTPTNKSYTLYLGNNPVTYPTAGQYFFDGMLDEVAIWSRALSDTEILNLYKRGAQQVKFQVRSCDDAACSGETFVGSDGTASTYFSEVSNSANAQPTFSISTQTRNRYFQYKSILTTISSTYKPSVSAVNYTYTNYPVDKPTVYSTSSKDLSMIPLTIDHFCEGTLDISSNCTPTSTKPANTEIYYQICGDTVANCNGSNTWKYWDGAAWTNASSSTHYNTASVINTNIGSFVPTTRYFAFKSFLSSGGLSTPLLSDVSIDVTYDSTVPDQNANTVQLTGISDGAWTNTEPTITWSAGSDNVGGLGLLGYCVALEEATIGLPTNLNPVTSAGMLGSIDDGVTETYCPYIATGTSLDLNSLTGLNLTTNKQYYFSIKAVDLAGNIWNGASNTYQNLISFKYDNTVPLNPAFISMPSNFISSKDATITWPTGDGNSASDVGAGVAGLQYRIGSSGTWYGDLHNGNQNLTDLLTNDGAYTTDATYDYPNLVDGNNVIYFRTLDFAGNISSSTVTGVLRINTTSPSSPQNLNVTPSTNTTNSYSFSWDPPATYVGNLNAITYCYTVNTVPTVNTCTYTSAGATSLASDAFANQPGDNTFYLVAKDESGNINYATYTSVVFTYSGEAPGIPLNVYVADISNKDNSDWKLAVTWSAPTNVGAGIANYEVYRSNTDTTCSLNMGAFTKVSTVLGVSYIDTGLSQQDYYYCVKACDSANNCSAVSATATEYPTGRYTSPATLVSGPDISAKSTTKAVINWVTDRRSDSKVQYGLTSGQYFEEEFAISAQVTAHTITLNNLKAGTTYYYRAKWTDEDGNTGISDEKTFVTDAAPVVSNAKATSVGIDSALINFTVKNAASVKIYYGKTRDFGAVRTLNTAFTESSYTSVLSGLDDASKYYFKLNPVDLDGVEYQGTILDFTTLPRPTVSNITIQEEKNVAQPTIVVSWNSNTDITSIVSFYPTSNPANVNNVVDLDLKRTHSLKLEGLMSDTSYSLVVRGTDLVGNTATSSVNVFTTATDTRPPAISNIKIESLIPDSSSNTAQIVVSWDTDEPATSQVEYGEGSSGAYAQSTQIDKTLSTKHVVIISNLKTSSVYHLQVVSEDNSKNESRSGNIVTITSDQSNSVIEIILKQLENIFGFL